MRIKILQHLNVASVHLSAENFPPKTYFEERLDHLSVSKSEMAELHIPNHTFNVSNNEFTTL